MKYINTKILFLFLFLTLHCEVSSASSLIQRQALVSGNFLIFEFTENYGSAFGVDDKVIIGFKNGETHTKLIGTLRTKAYPNSESEILDDNLISLWGAKFRLENDGAGNLCLFRFGNCYAHFKTTLFDTNFTRSLYFQIINGSLNEMLLEQNRVATSICGQRPQQMEINRNLGDILFRSVRLLDVIPYVDTHEVYLNRVQQSVSYIRSNYTFPDQLKQKYYQTDYHRCRGVSEFMTGHMVARGIFEFYKLSKDEGIKAYLSDILTNIVDADHAITVKNMASTAPNYEHEVYANMHAQFLNVLVLRDELRVKYY